MADGRRTSAGSHQTSTELPLEAFPGVRWVAFKFVCCQVSCSAWLGDPGPKQIRGADQAKQLKLRCKRGVVEVLAQTLQLAWPEDGRVPSIQG